MTLPFVFTIDALARKTTGDAKELSDDFHEIVGLFVAFYFVSETAVRGLESVQTGRLGPNP